MVMTLFKAWKEVGDNYILVVEALAIWKAMVTVIQKQWVKFIVDGEITPPRH